MEADMAEFCVKQLKTGGFDDNFSYVVYAESNADVALIDPCGDTSIIYAALKEFEQYQLRYILLTHGHRDHISGVPEFKNNFSAPVIAHPDCSFSADQRVQNHEKLPLGSGFIECLYAPGHTRDGLLYRLSDDSALFTGDTLFIDCCGYCDASSMFNTMRQVIFPLADSNIVYSGHDYGREPNAPLGVEKQRNPYLAAKTLEQFKEALKQL
jgi:glyoxylase-like metal-dependent hydrolase (beta-lactamase superfamily II)